MKYVIINADDYGLSEGVNRGIVECFRAGVVTNAGFIVNTDASAHGAQLAKESGLPLGLHLNLFSSSHPKGHELFGPSARLREILRQREEEGREDVDVREEEIPIILEEVDRQIAAFVDLVGRRPNHLSYHFGLHFVPRLFDALVSHASKLRIPFRLGRQYDRGDRELPFCRHPDRWIDDFHGVGLTAQHLFACLERVGEGVNEISVHPGYQTDGFSDPYGTERENELRILLSSDVRERLRRGDFILTDYSILEEV